VYVREQKAVSDANTRILAMLASTMEQHVNRYASDISELAPMYFLYKGDKVHTMAVTLMEGDPRQRSALAGVIAEMAKKEGCDGYTFSMEAWSLPPEKAHTHTGGSLADNPHRIEILNVEAGTIDGGHGVLVADIQRPTPEQVVLVQRPPVISGQGGAKLQSRFNIFNPVVPTPRFTADLLREFLEQARAGSTTH
jgi:hypothetical protein